MKRFEYYRQLKKRSIRILVQHGLTIRQAIETLQVQMPYMFKGKSHWDAIDADYEKYPIFNN